MRLFHCNHRDGDDFEGANIENHQKKGGEWIIHLPIEAIEPT